MAEMDRNEAMFVKQATDTFLAEIMSLLNRIRKLTRAVRLRRRLQRTAKAFVVSVSACLLIAALTNAAVTLEIIDTAWFVVAGWLCGSALLSTLILSNLRPLSDIEAAVLLDQAGNFDDRLSNALAFAQEENQTPMMRLAIMDADSVIVKADPAKAAPWAPPPRLRILGISTLLLLLTAWVPSPEPEAVLSSRVDLQIPSPSPKQEQRPVLLAEDKQRVEEEVRKVEQELERSEDPRLKQWLAELNDLLRELAKGTLSPKDAFARMGELKRAKEAWDKQSGEGLQDIKERLAKAAKKRKKRSSKELDELRKALEDARLKAAATHLDKLAEKLRKNALSRRERNNLAKDLDILAKKLESERDRRLQKLKKERDRLKRKRDRKKDRFAKRDQDRLKKNKRELDRLRREKEEQSEARRTLDRLRRNLSQAAQDLMRRLGKNAQQMSPEEIRQAAEMLRRLSQQDRTRQRMKLAEAKMIDVQEMLRRAGKKGDNEKRGKQDKMKRFMARARGDDKNAGQNGRGGGDGKEKITMLKPGGKDGQSLLLGPSGQAKMKGQGNKGREQGEGIGDGHDPHILGQKTKLKARFKEDFVAGREGKGESKSRVVFSAATKGFASRAYRKVHQDYEGVVEEKMERQEVPAGKRRYVRRYFDLIRPR